MDEKIWKIKKVLAKHYDELCLQLPSYIRAQQLVGNCINTICKTSGKNINNILEVGCGTGITTGEILANCDNVTIQAIEPDNSMLHFAKKRTNIFNNRISFVNSDIFSYYDDIKDDKKKFDHIVCTFTLHNLDLSIQREALNIFRNLITDNGYLFIADYIIRRGVDRVACFCNHVDDLFNVLVAKNEIVTLKEWIKHSFEDFQDTRVQNENSLIKMIEECGFCDSTVQVSGNLETIITCRPKSG